MHASVRYPSARRVAPSYQAPPEPSGNNGFIITFGILLPIIALSIELATHMSREIYFDPIPRVIYLICVALVPVANILGLFASEKRSWLWMFVVSNLNTAAILITAIYAVIYVPIFPFALLGIFAMGIGLLPLSPVLSLLATISVRVRLNRLLSVREYRSGWICHLGLLAAAAALILPLIPVGFTYHAAKCALERSGTARDWGLSWLRASADIHYLKQSASQRRSGADFLRFWELTPIQANQALFLATGRTIETVGGNFASSDFSRFDENRGMQQVGQMIPEVSMNLSTVNSSIDAAGGVAYTEWTFAFRNGAAIQNEARMEVQLPPHGVVSRLTLWINGEPHEAAFGTRHQTIAAYQNVVQQRRDPVLVTSSGEDKILIQCFPVPPNGGSMQARVGISAPLQLRNDGSGELLLPQVLHRNFTLGESQKTQCWFEARSPMFAPGLTKWAAPEPGTYALRGEQSTLQLGGLRVRSHATVKPSFYREDDGRTVLQVAKSMPLWRPEKIAIVLDSGVGLAQARDELQRSLSYLPPDSECTLFLVNDDDATALTEMRRFRQHEAELCRDALASVKFGGGRSNAGALQKAWEAVSGSPRGAILWLHGEEPEYAEPFELLNCFERHPGSPKLFSMQVTPGRNAVSEKLAEFPAFQNLPWQNGAISMLLQDWSSRGEQLVLERALSSALPEDAVETSKHLLKIWANEQTARHLENGQREAAAQLAVAEKIVTPVSGAVVLESQAQYEAAGLKPETRNSVPTIPEPEAAILLAITLGVLFAQRRRERKNFYRKGRKEHLVEAEMI